MTCQCGQIIQDTNNRGQNQAKAGGKKISQGPNSSPIEHRIFGGTGIFFPHENHQLFFV